MAKDSKTFKTSRIPQYIVLAIFGLLLARIIWPYIGSIILALFFAVVFFPLYKVFINKLRFSKNLSAFAIIFLTIIFILGPLVILLGLVIKEAAVFAQAFEKEAALALFNKYSEWDVFGYHIDLASFTQQIQGLLEKAGQKILTIAEGTLANILNFTFLFFVFLFLYFYFLRDGEKLLAKARTLLPFNKKQKNTLFNDFKSVAKTVFIGNLAGAILSGFFAYIGFWVFQIKAPLIWALLTALLSLLPSIGTFIVYAIGAIIAGFMSGLYFGLGLFAYFLAVEFGLVQNLLRPKMLDDKIQVHPILVFFSLAGGVQVFGSPGILYGPLIVVIFVSIFEFMVDTKAKT